VQDIRICFLGDSLVNGTGDETAQGWVARVCAGAAAKGSPVTCYNLGIRRETSRDILSRWQNECARRLPGFCDGRVVLSCGVNDTVIEEGKTRVDLDESLRNVAEILQGAAKKYKVLLVGPPPVGDEAHNVRIQVLSNALAEAARLQNIPFIDLFSPMISDVEYKQDVLNNDGAHPTARGYQKLAAIVSSSPQWWFL